MSREAAMPSIGSGDISAFLRRELAPLPGRWVATVRVTVACVACTIPIMAFHLNEPLIVMILMFLVAREDTTTTVLGTILAVVGATLGCVGLLFFYLCLVDLPWLRVLSIPAFVAVALFTNRAVALGPIGSAFGIPLALGMVVPDIISSGEYLSRFPFYLWWSVVLGLGTNLIVQFMLSPKTAQSVLVRGLTSRIEAVESLLRHLADDEALAPGRSLASLALAGTLQQFQLLRLTAVFEPALRNKCRTRIAQIILTDRLLTAAAVLEARSNVTRSVEERARLRALADACAQWRNEIETEPVVYVQQIPLSRSASEIDDIEAPIITEIERVLELAPLAYRPDLLPGDLTLPEGTKTGLLLPDAFTNPDYVRYAVKGALAALICYLAFTVFAYPGIYTSVITCIVCAFTTVGASVQKGVLRFAGAAIGGGLGVFTLMYIFPRVDSLGGFWLPFAAVTSLAAYVNFGSARISYCGAQIGVAFYKCVLQGYGPYVELRVARDRLIGIALGLAVFGFINARLWPVKATVSGRLRLADALRQLARLASLPDEAGDPALRMAEAYRLRLSAYKDFTFVSELIEGSRFEADAQARGFNEALAHKAQQVFLSLLAMLQHRADLRPDSVSETLRLASARFRSEIARILEAVADRLSDKGEGPVSDPASALSLLNQTFYQYSEAIGNAHLAVHVRGRHFLYKEASRALSELVQMESERNLCG